ncbi:hypothetical protein EZS27_032848 [termite gut metagenome]|uniref:Integrase catalytic domain-containing protein n=1 Tax=termite gut metagenome TaxID=433724 RepID=A0A5J4Q7R6_9ZZZZ
MGAKKLLIYLQAKFQAMNIHIGRDAFIELLYRNFMLVRRMRNKRKTTFSNHWMHKYPNLIKNYHPMSSNQLWVSDITYIETSQGFAYLCLITDAYSRKIVGWNLSPTLRSNNACEALQMALKTLPENHTGLIHHSDRGVQYCCSPYVRILDKHTIRISMTESGDPLENAIAERINGILKTEWIYNRNFKSWQEAELYVKQIIDLYNNQRPHQSIDYMVPSFVHQTNLPTERKWKNYYQENNKTAKEKSS